MTSCAFVHRISTRLPDDAAGAGGGGPVAIIARAPDARRAS
jgi:hypothetical protein